MNEPLTESDCYGVLSNHRRRLILSVLQRTGGGSLATNALVDRVAAREYRAPTEGERCKVHVSLHHVHLPRLDDGGVVSWDREDGTVRRRPNFDILVHYAQVLNEATTT